MPRVWNNQDLKNVLVVTDFPNKMHHSKETDDKGYRREQGWKFWNSGEPGFAEIFLAG
jgi:hypothetical protein